MIKRKKYKFENILFLEEYINDTDLNNRFCTLCLAG